MSTLSSAIDWKLLIKDTDVGWTILAKRVLNGVMDYAHENNKDTGAPRFKSIKIGEWAEVDNYPGFYATFANFNAQAQSHYHRREHIFQLNCTFTCKGADYREALQELLEIFGTFQKTCEDDKVMRIIVADPVPETYHIELAGLVTGTATGTTPKSFEYIYGKTILTVKAILDARK